MMKNNILNKVKINKKEIERKGVGEIDHPYGHFNDDGSEFIITDPKTPRAFDNFLWNDVIFSSVLQTGTGFIDYQIGDTEAIQLLTGVGRTCDLEVFGRDGLMSRLIYIRDNETGEYWNVNWEPVKKEYEYYRCRHGLGYSIIESATNGIHATFRIFIPKGNDPVELWTLELENKSDKKRDLSVFVYNQFMFSYKWGFNSYGDMLFRTSYFNHEQNAMIAAKKPHIAPHNYLTSYLTTNKEVVSYDGSRDFFVGQYNSLNEPEAVINGKCTNTQGASDATIGAIHMDISLEPSEKDKIEMILGVTDKEEHITVHKEKYLEKSDVWFDKLQLLNNNFKNKNKITTPDKHLDRMINVWAKQITSYGAQWCRWGWMGYRDIVQHGYGVSSINPELTKSILIEAFQYQYSDGRALRGWNPVDEKPYSDSGLWLVFTLVSYLKETGDTNFLNQIVAYYDKGEDSVLAHIEQALNFLETNRGEHDLVLIKFGDWNDSLTGIGKEGRGESVWLSMAYAEALNQMMEVYTFLGEKSKFTGYKNNYQRIKKAINSTAWDGDWFVRCFDDDGKPVGSDKNKQGKIFLNTQSWALISGVADEERTNKLLNSVDKRLKTEIGYLLLAPTFFEFDPGIGRISSMAPGICENGTVYSHVNIWMIFGFLRAGKVDEAYNAFKRFTPGYLTGEEDDPKREMPPFLFANGYYGPDHKNNKFQMEYTWITGSVSWIYNVIMKEMIGIKPFFDGLIIDPKLPSEWKNIQVEREYQGKIFHIEIERKDVKQTEVICNGKRSDTNYIEWSKCEPENTVQVFIP